jgi:hypothetical protein
MFAAGDYVKTNDNLGQLTRSENEFKARALPWKLVVASGMAQGYMELAKYYEYGARAKKDNPTPFRKHVNLYRGNASQLAMQFAEAFQQFQQTVKDEKIKLEFSLPPGSAAEIQQLKKVSSGMLLQQSEMDDLERRSLTRGVLLAICRAIGAGQDTAKAQQVFKSGPVEIDRPTFLLAMANSMADQSELFARDKLDRPDRVELFSKQALEALKGIPETKETKALAAKVQKSLKKKP